MKKLGNLYMNKNNTGELCCSKRSLPIWWQRVTINTEGEIFEYEETTKHEYQNEVAPEKKEELDPREYVPPFSGKFDPVLSKQKL
jgi:hypothetical protein